MATLQSILVPLDGSPPSLAALEYAVGLARDYGADLEVLHVVPPSDPVVPNVRADIERDMDAAVDRGEERLNRRIVRITRVGDPLREIIERAEDHDLVVMGTHGRIGRLHSLLGSIAEGVVRNAPCPVLTIRDVTGGYQGFAERRHRRSALAEQYGPSGHR